MPSPWVAVVDARVLLRGFSWPFTATRLLQKRSCHKVSGPHYHLPFIAPPSRSILHFCWGKKRDALLLSSCVLCAEITFHWNFVRLNLCMLQNNSDASAYRALPCNSALCSVTRTSCGAYPGARNRILKASGPCVFSWWTSLIRNYAGSETDRRPLTSSCEGFVQLEMNQWWKRLAEGQEQRSLCARVVVPSASPYIGCYSPTSPSSLLVTGPQKNLSRIFRKLAAQLQGFSSCWLDIAAWGLL